jgi:hypothetical protein
LTVAITLAMNMREVIMSRGNKRQYLDPPERWAPGRTLYSITEMPLTAAAISEAEQQLGVSNDQSRESLTGELQSIARRYREQHHDTERPSAAWYRTNVGSLQKRTEDLVKLLREPQGTALTQLRFRTERDMGRSLLGMHREPPSLEQLLDDFVGVCKTCESASAKGAPSKTHIKTAVAELRELWIQLTGKVFPLNLESADDRTDRNRRGAANEVQDEAFISPGPRFVQVMMHRIDPNVRIGAIRTALREAASVKAGAVD